MLNIFRNKKKPTISDPVFGLMTFDGKSTWEGTVPLLAGASPVVVRVHAGPDGPTEGHRSAFASLRQGYLASSPAIASALFGLYGPYLDESPEMRPRPTDAQQMMALMVLDWIEVRSPELIRLGYGFVEGAGWDDAMFSVRVEGSQVIGEALSD